MPRLKHALKCLLAAFFIVAGTIHFLRPGFYERIVPPYLPWHLALVLVSGFCEIALGALVLVPGWTRAAAWGLIALLIAVFPANLHMALHADDFPNVSPAMLWLRLPLQGLLIAWPYWFTRGERP
jgi:uncharacterized membrane protein